MCRKNHWYLYQNIASSKARHWVSFNIRNFYGFLWDGLHDPLLSPTAKTWNKLFGSMNRLLSYSCLMHIKNLSTLTICESSVKHWPWFAKVLIKYWSVLGKNIYLNLQDYLLINVQERGIQIYEVNHSNLFGIKTILFRTLIV